MKNQGLHPGWETITRNKSALLFFEEPSTRTRISFELAAHHLGLKTIHLTGQTSSMRKGETLGETLRFLTMLRPDLLIIRTSHDTWPYTPENNHPTAFVNAGSGTSGHPTQALLDYVTLYEHLGRVDQLKIGFCGDISRSRVFRSHLRMSLLFSGIEVGVCTPRPVHEVSGGGRPFLHFESRQALIEFADVIIVLRNQKERGDDASFEGGSVDAHQSFYRLSRQDVPDDKIIMHPGPINFDTDMDIALLDHPRSLIDRQVENGLFTRMYLMGLLLGCENL